MPDDARNPVALTSFECAGPCSSQQPSALVLHETWPFHERETKREKERADKWKAKCQKLRDEVAGLQASAAAAESTWKVCF